jgi:hypothetical protein
MKKYTVEVSRWVNVPVDVEADSPEDAVAIVDRVSYQLPDPAEWSIDKYSYEYVVYDDQGEEVYRAKPSAT